MSHPVISVENLSKSYRLGQIGTGTLSNDLKVWTARIRGKPNPMLRIGQKDPGDRAGEILWALKDVTFQVEQGEVLGIIGRNGAGKSTLLKVLSRVTAPTSGCVKVKGRIASLLEVGTGFHPELTGRENIYLNGAILGMTKEEVRRKFDEIVAFAEIDKFIDTPVKRYSSGMYVRLAFAVAAHLESEILIVDEVLAVGDIDFQKKCLGKMGEVASKEGRTVLFVSHNMGAVQNLTQQTILLDFGIIVLQDKSDIAISKYIEGMLSNRPGNKFIDLSSNSSYIKVVTLSSGKAENKNLIRFGDNIIVNITGHLQKSQNLEFVIAFFNQFGVRVFTATTKQLSGGDIKLNGKFNVECELQNLNIVEGRYSVKMGVFSSGRKIEEFDPLTQIDIIDEGASNGLYRYSMRHGIIYAEAKWKIEIDQ